MREVKELFELDASQAGEAFAAEILGPMLGLGLLDDNDSPSWDLLSVMLKLYCLKPRFTKQRLVAIAASHRGAELQDLERTVFQRFQAPRCREISELLCDHDLDVVYHWLDPRKRDKGLRARFGIDLLKRLNKFPIDDQGLRGTIEELARSGKLHAPPSRDVLLAAETEHTQEESLTADSWRSVAEAAQASSADPGRGMSEPVCSVANKTPSALPSEPVPQGPMTSTLKRALPLAIVAEPDAKRIRERVARDLSDATTSAAKQNILDLELAFSKDRIGGNRGIALVRDLPEGHELWFIGDLHGDLVGFEAAVEHVGSEGAPDCTIVFLGDVIDDGFHAYELILRLFEEMAKSPGRHVLLAGNHDEALAAHSDGDATRFTSSVDPGEFSVWLNSQLNERDLSPDRARQIINVGLLFQKFVDRAPRALFLPGGLFAAHGGFPHNDLWDSLDKPEAMTTKNCLNDFVWNRWSDQSTKFPNRSSSQSQFGAKDFLGFCDRATKIMGQNVTAMVRGHDHISSTQERYERKEKVRHASYEGRILTVNNMCFTMPREVLAFSAPDPRKPVLARWRYGMDELPTPIILELPTELVSWYAPRCEACGRANDTRSYRCDLQALSQDGRCGGQLFRRNTS